LKRKIALDIGRLQPALAQGEGVCLERILLAGHDNAIVAGLKSHGGQLQPGAAATLQLGSGCVGEADLAALLAAAEERQLELPIPHRLVHPEAIDIDIAVGREPAGDSSVQHQLMPLRKRVVRLDLPVPRASFAR
jgi:hypothetical protein